jgi:hypothetical protein
VAGAVSEAQVELEGAGPGTDPDEVVGKGAGRDARAVKVGRADAGAAQRSDQITGVVDGTLDVHASLGAAGAVKVEGEIAGEVVCSSR